MKAIKATDAFAAKGAIGQFILIYGDINVGKTCSSIQSLWGNTLGIFTEPRDIQLNIEAAKRDPNTFYYDPKGWKNFADLREFLVDHDNFKDMDTILFDGISHGMHLVLKETARDAFLSTYGQQGEIEKSKFIDKALSKEMKTSQETYGTMASAMLLIIELLGDIVQTGKTVVCTARLDEPDDARKSQGKLTAPLYKGKMFGNDVSAWFDLIGLVEEKQTRKAEDAEQPLEELYKNDKNESVYKRAVPTVSFNLAHAVTKRTGIAPSENGWNDIPLDFKAICRAGNKTNNTTNNTTNTNTGEHK